ncbi:MAG: hypothetical protein BWY63_01362 [Chloroflexi bacterium ADurb.Bin360]|nr:MAG: hypothetical protein BWY63_01362 [Chloroflexi bacterium ADurb.Bin360]
MAAAASTVTISRIFAAGSACDILYLADNAGEIVLDRLLIEALGPARVTVAVRGAPVINDATMDGSDAPGTVLSDCSEAFQERFRKADLVISKGQGNFETLSGAPRDVCFLFKVKCPVISSNVGLPPGTQALLWSRAGKDNKGES